VYSSSTNYFEAKLTLEECAGSNICYRNLVTFVTEYVNRIAYIMKELITCF